MSVAASQVPRAPSRSVLALALLVACVFGQTLSFEFLSLDDPTYVTSYAVVGQGLTASSVRWALTSTRAAMWQPLTWLSHMADVSIFGANPGGHHLTSVVLHAASAVILFFALDLLTGARWRSWLVAALFAVHPLRADSVAWVAERKDVLCAFFSLAGLLAYARWVRSPSRWRLLTVVLAHAAALASKPAAVPFPLALLLVDAWPLGRLTRQSWRRCLLEKTPLWLLSVAGAVVTLLAHSRVMVAMPMTVRARGVVVSYGLHLWHTLVPLHLSIFYPHWYAGGDPLPAFAVPLAALAIALLLALALLARRRAPYVTFGIAWFLGLLLPESGVLQSGMGMTADRFTYVPTIGLAVALVWLAADGMQRAGVRPALMLALGGAVTGGYALVGYFAVAAYHDTVTVFTAALESTGSNWMAEQHLGTAALDAGNAPEAVERFARAASLVPTNVAVLTGLGRSLGAAGRSAEAIAPLERALALDPGARFARVDLCRSLQTLGRTDEADRCREQLRALTPAGR
jgi:hypothetical protein